MDRKKKKKKNTFGDILTLPMQHIYSTFYSKF